MTSYPRLGAPGVFTEPHFDPAGAVSSHSFFLPEEITNPHARFPSVVFSPVASPALNPRFLLGLSLPTSDAVAGLKWQSTSRCLSTSTRLARS